MRFNLFNVKSSVCSMAGLKKITTGADPGFFVPGGQVGQCATEMQ